MTEKLGVNEKEPAFGQKTPTTTTATDMVENSIIAVGISTLSITLPKI